MKKESIGKILDDTPAIANVAKAAQDLMNQNPALTKLADKAADLNAAQSWPDTSALISQLPTDMLPRFETPCSNLSALSDPLLPHMQNVGAELNGILGPNLPQAQIGRISEEVNAMFASNMRSAQTCVGRLSAEDVCPHAATPPQAHNMRPMRIIETVSQRQRPAMSSDMQRQGAEGASTTTCPSPSGNLCHRQNRSRP